MIFLVSLAEKTSFFFKGLVNRSGGNRLKFKKKNSILYILNYTFRFFLIIFYLNFFKIINFYSFFFVYILAVIMGRYEMSLIFIHIKVPIQNKIKKTKIKKRW